MVIPAELIRLTNPIMHLDKYPTVHHFVTEMCTRVHISVTKWCIVGYLSNASWDLCNRPCYHSLGQPIYLYVYVLCFCDGAAGFSVR